MSRGTTVIAQLYPYSPYCGPPPSSADLWARWNLDPILLVALAAAPIAWLLVNRGRGERAGAGRDWAALAGWLIAALAFTSPLCALSVSLFSARIGQHMLLEMVAAPLVAIALRPTRGRAADVLLASAAFAAALIFWHAPAPYVATFDSTAVYWIMHLTLFGSALWFWRGVLCASPYRAMPALAATLGVSLTMALVGAVILFSPEPLYAPHMITAWAWGLTPLVDQQLGAIVMWVPAGIIFVVFVMMSLAMVMRRDPQSARRGALA